MTRFLDPSAPFDLQFDASDAVAEKPEPTVPAVPTAAPLPVPAAPAIAEGSDDEPPKPSEGAEVVRLDRFRKK